MSVIMGSVAPRFLGIASGLSASMRTLGMMTSMTVITVVFSVLMKGAPIAPSTLTDFLFSMRTALQVFAGLCLLGIACSFRRLTPESSSNGPII